MYIYQLHSYFCALLLMHHMIIELVVLWICGLATLTYVQGNRFNIAKETLIFVDSESLYCDDSNNLKLKESDTVNDYFKYCDDYYNSSGSGYMYNMSDNAYTYFFGNCICCTVTLCLCDSMEGAQHHTQNNTVIALTNSVNLVSVKPFLFIAFSVTVFEHITNLSLTGYNNATIDCNFISSVHFNHCNNVIIQNITWINCGNNRDDRGTIADSHNYHYTNNFKDHFFNIYHDGIKLDSCTNVFLKNCTFIASMVGISSVSGLVHIDQVNFLSVAHLIKDDYYTATTLIINQINASVVSVKITNSLFSTIDNKGILLFYVLVDNPEAFIDVIIDHTNFTHLSFDPGWVAENGLIWMRLSCNNNITFNEVNITSNSFAPSDIRLAAILSVTANLSMVQRNRISIVKIKSCVFFNNSANVIAHFNGDVYSVIIDTSFSNNNANSIFSASRIEHNGYDFVGMQILHSLFLSNTGGHLVSVNCIYTLFNMTKIQIINNTLSSQYNSLLTFYNYTTLVANFNEINYELNRIDGEGSGFHFVPRKILKIHHPLIINRYDIICFSPEFQIIHCFEGRPIHQFFFANSSFNNNTGGGHGLIFHLNLNMQQYENTNTISMITVSNNSDCKSLIYSTSSDLPSTAAQLIVKDSTFTHNEETVFYMVNQILEFANEIKPTVFDSNRAQNGAAIYLNLDSKIKLNNNSVVLFYRNVARRYGGAIYYDVTPASNACNKNTTVFLLEENIAPPEFKSNVAGFAGNSIYYSISQSCNNTIQYNEIFSSVFNQSVGEVTASPYRLKLYFPAQLVNETDHNTYYVNEIMLGQNILIPACVLDQQEMPTGPVQFMVQLVDNNIQDYIIEGSNLITANCKTLQGINNLFITGNPPSKNSTITIHLSSFYDSTDDWKPITVNLDVRLSSCHSGFYYNDDLDHCICYTTDDIVTCSDSNSSIQIGYWFGTINNQPTVTTCPLGYCNFEDCQSITGTCNLYPLRNNQCSSHRSGTACGNCDEGYTLSFDSNNCISVDKCTTGQSILVVMISCLFWITSIVVVFSIMYFKIDIGYLYGITFYYSTIDVLFKETSFLSENIHQFVIVLSSVAKLIPQFLGELCLVKGLSGIDQQFIHYIHPLAILLLLSLFSFSTRFSRRLSMLVSRAVIHAICLLLLLSYTSIASTSLLLMRSIRYANVDKVCAYLSPDMEYFHGRHLFYVLMAAVVGLVIVIGLPLLLSLEPFINNKINFIRIKPFLDQFQGCYKDKFRYFASYYMIFRLLILTIVVINPTNVFITLYTLLVTCSLLTFIHIAVKPYASHPLNLYDSFMLFILMLIIPLMIVEAHRGFSPNTTNSIALLLITAPLVAFLVLVAYVHRQNIKKIAINCVYCIKSPKPIVTARNEINEMHQCEHDTIVDQKLRDKSTTIV